MTGPASEGRVLGVGGLFVRSPDPAALMAWYRDVLGVGSGFAAQGDANEWTWRTQGGDKVFEPFSQSSNYFAADKACILNLRVSGLDALTRRIEALGLEVEQRAEWNHSDTGRFARIHDRDGNPIELWEPPES